MSNRVLKAGITLAAIAAICTALVAATYSMTGDRIAANEQAWLEQSLTPALSGIFFDGSVTESMLVVPPPHELSTRRSSGHHHRRPRTPANPSRRRRPECRRELHRCTEASEDRGMNQERKEP